MATGHRVYSDLFNLSDFITQTAVSQGKNLLIDALREYFAKDTFYRYETDGFGFPLTPNLTDMPADIEDERTTRIYIGDVFRMDIRFFPAVVVKYSSGRTHHISFNQNHTTRYRLDLVIDGYGGRSYVHTPTHHVIAGAWDQTFEISIASESTQDREELSDIISSFFMGVARQELYKAGLFIKNVSIGGESQEVWGNDQIFTQAITLETFSEFRIEQPINDLCEVINLCFNYGIFGGSTFTDTTRIDQSDI